MARISSRGKGGGAAATALGGGRGGGGAGPDAGPGDHDGSGSDGEAPEELTVYEKERLERISQNSALLKRLGIDQAVQSVRRAAAQQDSERARERATPRKRRALSPPTFAKPRGTRSRAGGRLAGGPDVDEAVLEERMRRFVESEDEEDVQAAAAWGKDDGVLLGNERVNVLPSHTDELDEGEKVVFDALRSFCLERAEEEGIEVYQVAQIRSLCEMIRMRPQTDAEMHLVWGMGDVKTEKYGALLVKILGEMGDKLRSGPRPVLDGQEEDGVVHVAESRKRLGSGVKSHGDSWKRLEWVDLDRMQAGSGLLVLRHNASKTYRRKVAAGDSLNEALQALARAGKKTGNPKITGFIKVVENAFLNDLPLRVILENWLCSGRGPTKIENLDMDDED